jgi:predicted RNase H-like HicB family nuclease
MMGLFIVGAWASAGRARVAARAYMNAAPAKTTPSFRDAAKPAGPESITTNNEVFDAIRDYLRVGDYGFRAPRFARPRNDERLGTRVMAFGYRFKLERQRNGWWLVRFPGIPEALTEGETESEARRNAVDCVIAALEGYMKAGRPLPRQGAGDSARRAD